MRTASSYRGHVRSILHTDRSHHEIDVLGKDLSDIRLVRRVPLYQLDTTLLEERLQLWVGIKLGRCSEEESTCPFRGRGKKSDSGVIAYTTRGAEDDRVHYEFVNWS